MNDNSKPEYKVDSTGYNYGTFGRLEGEGRKLEQYFIFNVKSNAELVAKILEADNDYKSYNKALESESEACSCSACGGSGYYRDSYCGACNGTGKEM